MVQVQTQKEQQYRVFQDTFIDQLQKLRYEGFSVATPSDITRGRLDGKISWDRYYDTSGMIAYPGNNESRFKVTPHSQEILLLEKSTPLYFGGIGITREKYEDLPWPEFNRAQDVGVHLQEYQAKRSNLWAIMMPDENLRLNYIGEVFYRKSIRSIRENVQAMGFLIRNPQERPSIRVFYLDNLEGKSALCDFYGFDESARLVGVKK